MHKFRIALCILLLPALALAEPGTNAESIPGHEVSAVDSILNESSHHIDSNCLSEVKKQARLAQKKCDRKWRGENIYMRLHCSNKARELASNQKQACLQS